VSIPAEFYLFIDINLFRLIVWICRQCILRRFHQWLSTARQRCWLLEVLMQRLKCGTSYVNIVQTTCGSTAALSGTCSISSLCCWICCYCFLCCANWL